jgi:hypothetical protein
MTHDIIIIFILSPQRKCVHTVLTYNGYENFQQDPPAEIKND